MTRADRLGLVCVAHKALDGLPTERIKTEGVERVRDALFGSGLLEARARDAGVSLTTAAQPLN